MSLPGWLATGEAVVRLLLEFAKAFGIGEDAACGWLCERHPELGGAVARMRSARTEAVTRVSASEAPDTEPGGGAAMASWEDIYADE